jgi:rRNA processing protein Krr1/Pno1
MRRNWRYVEKNTHYYYQTYDGRVIGQAYNIAFTIVWGAKIPINATEELILGQYIELEYAKRAIEEYWQEKDRTFDMVDNEYLLSGPASENLG